jgi:hypothetical protein
MKIADHTEQQHEKTRKHRPGSISSCIWFGVHGNSGWFANFLFSGLT